jgi:murein DD-endopeptidase MepM/ murein hydrolase activator NlpD
MYLTAPSTQKDTMRRVLVLVSVFITSVLLVSALAGSGLTQSKSERIRDIRRQIDEASNRAQAELDAIAASDKRLNEVNDLIAALEIQVTDARQKVAAAQQVLDVAVSRVHNAEIRLGEAQVRFSRAKDVLSKRVVELYKYGRLDQAEAILDASSFEQAILQAKYNESVRQRNDSDAKAIGAAVKDLSEIRSELDEARKDAEARRDTLRAEQERLEEALGQQHELRIALEKEIETHRKILSGIEADRAKLERALDELEGQSRRVAGLVLSRGSGSGKLIWPATGPVTSGFGMRHHPILGYARMHTGVDIGAPMGAPVSAAASGIVAFAGWSGGYGNFIVIDHGDGLATAYAHLSRILVSQGQSVAQGQEIGKVGSTGLSSGPHLHFEVRVNGQPVDPMQYF